MFWLILINCELKLTKKHFSAVFHFLLLNIYLFNLCFDFLCSDTILNKSLYIVKHALDLSSTAKQFKVSKFYKLSTEIKHKISTKLKVNDVNDDVSNWRKIKDFCTFKNSLNDKM